MPTASWKFPALFLLGFAASLGYYARQAPPLAPTLETTTASAGRPALADDRARPATSSSPEPRPDTESAQQRYQRLRQRYSSPGIQAWLDSHGYAIAERYPDYQSYTNDNLESLAKSGDPVAQEVLGERLLNTDPRAAMGFFREATLHGYTVSIYGLIKACKLLQSLHTLDNPLEPYIWRRLLVLRHDAMIGNPQNQFLLPPMTDPESAKIIEQQAHAWLTAMNNERRQRGLPDFAETENDVEIGRQVEELMRLQDKWP